LYQHLICVYGAVCVDSAAVVFVGTSLVAALSVVVVVVVVVGFTCTLVSCERDSSRTCDDDSVAALGVVAEVTTSLCVGVVGDTVSTVVEAVLSISTSSAVVVLVRESDVVVVDIVAGDDVGNDDNVGDVVDDVANIAGADTTPTLATSPPDRFNAACLAGDPTGVTASLARAGDVARP
jgi:hypothetical protein